MDLRIIWEGRGKKRNPSAAPQFCQSSPSSLHTVFHQTILHLNITLVFIDVSALFVLFPSLSLLLSSTVLTWTLAHSPLPLHLMYYWRTQQAESKEEGRKKRKEGRGRTRGAKHAGGGCTEESFYTEYTKAYSYDVFWEFNICKLILTCITNTHLLSAASTVATY